ncbi:MAG: cytochrome c [Bacteroidota bacterium]|nr:cytochrome c [Bacteroidota bacterium]
MKNLFRLVVLLVGVGLLGGLGFLAFVQVRGIPRYPPPWLKVAIPSTPARVALGEKLTLSICSDCHLNRATNRYSGHRLADLTPDFGRIYTSNITQDAAHGIGRWTTGQLVALLSTGIGPDGRLRLIMPSYARMSDEDMASIVVFLRSNSPQVQPDLTATPPQEPSLLLKLLGNTIMRPARLPDAPVLAPPPTDTRAFGRYLVLGRYHCYECHSRDFKSNNPTDPEKSKGYLGGGTRLLNNEGQTVVSRNITGDAETGIGRWSEAQFGQAVRFGQSPNGLLHYPMNKYSLLTDAEVHALFAYLQSVPQIKNATPEDGVVTTQ